MIFDRIIGDPTRLPLDLVLSLRSQWLDRPISTVLTILALASSVALATAVEMSTHSLRVPLQKTTAALLGSAELSVQAGSMGVDVGENMELLDRIREVPGVELASPIINRTFRVEGGPLDGKPVRLLGIDLLADSSVRSFGVSQGDLKIRDPLRLLGRDNAIVISRTLAERLGLDSGSPLPLRSDRGKHTFTVHGTLEGALSEAYGGEVAVIDLFTLQDVLEFQGRVDRIDISLVPGAAWNQVLADVKEVIGNSAAVERSALRDEYADSVMGTLSIGIWSIAAIAILLSLFLSYTIASMMVDRRAEEFSLLRIAGMNDWRVVFMLQLDAILLSLISTIIGFLAAILLSDPLVSLFSRASEFIQEVQIPPSTVRDRTWAIALLVGPPIALIAAIEPAIRAVRGTGLSHIQKRQGPVDRLSAPAIISATLALVVCIVAWAGKAWLPGEIRVVAVIVGSIVLVGTGSPQLLVANYARIQGFLGRVIPRVGYLVSSSILDRPRETGATLAVWAAVSAALVAASSGVSSLVSTMDAAEWGLSGPNAILAMIQRPGQVAKTERFTRKNIEILRSTNGVLDVRELLDVTANIRGQMVLIKGFDTRVLLKHGDASHLSHDPDQAVSALLNGDLLITRSLQRRLGIRIGDTIELGSVGRLRVGGTFRSFNSPTGALALDGERLRKLFDVPPPRQLIFWTHPADRHRVIDALERTIQSQNLFFLHGEQRKGAIAKLFRRYNELMLIPIFLIGVLGLLSLTNLLFGNVVSRGRDLALLHAAGASRSDRIALIVIDGIFLGIVGTAAGIVAGILWTIVLVDRSGYALGFEPDLVFSLSSIGFVSATGVVLSLIAGAGPAYQMARRTGFGGLLRTE